MTGKNKHNSLLELRNITHRFKGVEALSNVNFSIESGEIHALVGENGAGKSTLVNIIAGILQPTEGTIVLHGEEVKINPAAAQAHHGISMVPQHVEIFPHLSIAENMFINNLPSKRGFIDYKELHQAAKSWFERFDLDLDPSVPMEELDFVQQKVIVILKALKEKRKNK